MAVTIGGVLCQELVNEFDETVELLGGPSANKVYLCDWASRYKVAVGILGLASTTKIGGVITLQTPMPYPEIPTTYAHSVRIKGVGPPFQGARNVAFPFAKVYASFRTMPWSFNPGDSAFTGFGPFVYAEQKMSSSCEWLHIPGYGCKYSPSGLYLNQPAQIRLVIVTMQISIKQLPYMPSDTVLTSAGLINNAPYLGVNTGSLMFDGCDTTTTAVSDGTYTISADYRFLARNIRWDYQYNPDFTVHDFEQVQFKGGSTPLISAIDMSTIIPTQYTY